MSASNPPESRDPLAWMDAAIESILVTTANLEPPGPYIVYANPAFEQMTGWSREEIVGRSPRLLQGDKTDKSVFVDLRETLARDGKWEGQAVNYRKDGQAFIMEWSISSVFDQRGDVYQYIAVQRDVTARVEMEIQLREAREAVIEGLKKRELMREAFGKFVPDAIADQLLADSGTLAPNLREATIFYSDIAGFSTLAERMNPSEIIGFLNEYFSLLTESIERNEGVIHQFQGDAVLATFNIPLEDPQHARHAIDTAIEIQDKLRTSEFGDGFAVNTRIGINTGTVVAGTVGSPGRLGYTVHGDAVNLTARIEQENKRFGTSILISEATVRKVGDRADFRRVDTIIVRGRQLPVTLYTMDS